MHIIIKAHHTELNQKEILQMERRIHFALGRFESGIHRISRAVDRKLSRRWRTPIRRMRKMRVSGMSPTIESEERHDDTIEKNTMIKTIPATMLANKQQNRTKNDSTLRVKRQESQV